MGTKSPSNSSRGAKSGTLYLDRTSTSSRRRHRRLDRSRLRRRLDRADRAGGGRRNGRGGRHRTDRGGGRTRAAGRARAAAEGARVRAVRPRVCQTPRSRPACCSSHAPASRPWARTCGKDTRVMNALTASVSAACVRPFAQKVA